MGGGGKEGDTKSSRALTRISQQLYGESTPLRQTLTGQTLEALRTGGVNAQIPAIRRMVEASRRGTQTALTSTEGSLARIQGLSKTPFGQNALADIRRQGAREAAMIPVTEAQRLASAAPNLVTSLTGLPVQGFGQAGSIEVGARGAAATQAAGEGAAVGTVLSAVLLALAAVSSLRFKQDVCPLDGDGVVQALTPISYHYKPEIINSPDTFYGLAAEEVAELDPNLVLFDEKGNPAGVRYMMLIPLLIGEVQRLHKKIEALEVPRA